MTNEQMATTIMILDRFDNIDKDFDSMYDIVNDVKIVSIGKENKAYDIIATINFETLKIDYDYKERNKNDKVCDTDTKTFIVNTIYGESFNRSIGQEDFETYKLIHLANIKGLGIEEYENMFSDSDIYKEFLDFDDISEDDTNFQEYVYDVVRNEFENFWFEKKKIDDYLKSPKY